MKICRSKVDVWKITFYKCEENLKLTLNNEVKWCRDDIDWLCGFTLTFAVFLLRNANEQSVVLKKDYIIRIICNRVKIKLKRLLRDTPARVACQPHSGGGRGGIDYVNSQFSTFGLRTIITRNWVLKSIILLILSGVMVLKLTITILFVQSSFCLTVLLFRQF